MIDFALIFGFVYIDRRVLHVIFFSLEIQFVNNLRSNLFHLSISNRTYSFKEEILEFENCGTTDVTDLVSLSRIVSNFPRF